MGGEIKLEGTVADKAEEFLYEIHKVFTRFAVPYCLDGGTLLGIVREQRLLPWDTDIDLYVSRGNVFRLTVALFFLKLAGYRVSKKHMKYCDLGPLKRGCLRVVKVRQKIDEGWLMIDVFIKYKESGRTYWVVGRKNAVLKSVDSRFYDKFDSIAFRGVSYPVPSDTESYLEARYGNWRVPKETWDFRTDDLAISREITSSNVFQGHADKA